jgi:hypothetical protein
MDGKKDLRSFVIRCAKWSTAPLIAAESTIERSSNLDGHVSQILSAYISEKCYTRETA